MSRSSQRPRIIRRPSGHADQERQARTWNKGVVQHWEAQLAPPMLDAIPLPSEGSVLVAECRTGYVAMKLVERLSPSVRCIAIDPSREMLDIARVQHADQERIWWEARQTTKLPYQAGVFGATICTAGVTTKDDLHQIARQLARVTSEGGPVGMLVPMAGSLSAFYDMFREALHARDLAHFEPALDAFVDDLLDEDALRVDLAAAGIRDVEVHASSLPLTFESGEDFLTHPLVASLYMPSWVQICRDEASRVQLFDHVVEALDTYFFGFEMTLEVRAAWLRGWAIARTS